MEKIDIAAIIDGVYRHDRNMGYELYALCRDYYEENFRGVFLVDEDSEKDIFQNTMITLLEKIDNRSIYSSNGTLYGKSGEKFSSSLTTYFMGIAKLKYKEWVRKHPIEIDINSKNGKSKVNNTDMSLYREMLYDDEENSKLSIKPLFFSFLKTLILVSFFSYSSNIFKVLSVEASSQIRISYAYCLGILSNSRLIHFSEL